MQDAQKAYSKGPWAGLGVREALMKKHHSSQTWLISGNNWEKVCELENNSGRSPGAQCWVLREGGRNLSRTFSTGLSSEDKDLHPETQQGDTLQREQGQMPWIRRSIDGSKQRPILDSSDSSAAPQTQLPPPWQVSFLGPFPPFPGEVLSLESSSVHPFIIWNAEEPPLQQARDQSLKPLLLGQKYGDGWDLWWFQFTSVSRPKSKFTLLLTTPHYCPLPVCSASLRAGKVWWAV